MQHNTYSSGDTRKKGTLRGGGKYTQIYKFLPFLCSDCGKLGRASNWGGVPQFFCLLSTSLFPTSGWFIMFFFLSFFLFSLLKISLRTRPLVLDGCTPPKTSRPALLCKLAVFSTQMLTKEVWLIKKMKNTRPWLAYFLLWMFWSDAFLNKSL